MLYVILYVLFIGVPGIMAYNKLITTAKRQGIIEWFIQEQRAIYIVALITVPILAFTILFDKDL